jgi:elongation factor Ts
MSEVISPAVIKKLREETQAGMMECKKALSETNGDYEAAKDWLRTKGLAKAAKKASRVAAEGLVCIENAGSKAVIIEFNSETDFVSKNADFQALTRSIAKAAINTNGDIEAIKAQKTDAGKTVGEAITDAIATIGENLNLRRAKVVTSTSGKVTSYIHSATAEGLGKIGVLVALNGGDEALGKQIAMHIAANKPEALTSAEISADTLAREKAIYTEQARESGKPEAVIEKMVEGRVRKYYEQVVLTEQPFVMAPEQKVSDVLKAAKAEITSFAFFVLGDGIEKEETDYAAEVAATMAAAAGGR